MPHPPDATRLLRFASAAVDVHHHTSLPDQHSATRAELDALHAHCVALFRLLDTHTTTARSRAPAQVAELHAARVRLWQTADALHTAYHHAPRPGGGQPAREDLVLRHPEGAPEIVICHRHTRAAARMRRLATAAELRGTPTVSRA